MLDFSVASFRRWFGEEHLYVVFTDDPRTLKLRRRIAYEIQFIENAEPVRFNDRRATWTKWAPAVRLDRMRVEFRIDADVFLLQPSHELFSFCNGGSPHQFVVLQEEFSAAWPYGNFATRLRDPRVPINAGFVGQAAGADFSSELEAAYRIWLDEVSESEIKYHDEQGAVAYALEPYVQSGNVMLLDPSRYRVVCPLNDPPVESLAGIDLMHATYPDHPAFYHFLPELSTLTGLSAGRPPEWPEAPRWDKIGERRLAARAPSGVPPRG